MSIVTKNVVDIVGFLYSILVNLSGGDGMKWTTWAGPIPEPEEE